MLCKILLFVATVLLVSQNSLAAPMPAPACFVPTRKFDSRFIGSWEIAEWKLRYSILGKGKQICLYARDVQEDEWFEISGLKWDGKVLSAAFLMPSTKWHTQSRLTLVDANKLRDEYRNKDGKHTDFWTRRK